VLDGYSGATADSINSMLADRMAGGQWRSTRGMGHRAQRRAARHRTPLNRMAVALLQLTKDTHALETSSTELPQRCAGRRADCRFSGRSHRAHRGRDRSRRRGHHRSMAAPPAMCWPSSLTMGLPFTCVRNSLRANHCRRAGCAALRFCAASAAAGERLVVAASALRYHFADSAQAGRKSHLVDRAC